MTSCAYRSIWSSPSVAMAITGAERARASATLLTTLS